LSGDLANSAEGGILDIVEVESLEVTHCDEVSEVGERRLFILVEDLVVWLDEVIGRPSSTTENPSNFWWHITPPPPDF